MKKIIGLFFICIFTAKLCAEPEVSITKAPREIIERGESEYIMVFKDFPKNQEFIVQYSRIMQKDPDIYKSLEKISIDDMGLLTINGKAKFINYGISYQGYAPGEAIKYKLILPDGKAIAETTFTPKPICEKSKNGTFCIKADLKSWDPTIYSITCEGLETDEKIHITSTSADELIERDAKYNPLDAFLIFPSVEGKNGGLYNMEILRANGDKARIKLKWGDAILKDALKEAKKKKHF